MAMPAGNWIGQSELEEFTILAHISIDSPSMTVKSILASSTFAAE